KINGILSFVEISLIASAVSITNFSLSITQGPAIKTNGLFPPIFICSFIFTCFFVISFPPKLFQLLLYPLEYQLQLHHKSFLLLLNYTHFLRVVIVLTSLFFPTLISLT